MSFFNPKDGSVRKINFQELNRSSTNLSNVNKNIANIFKGAFVVADEDKLKLISEVRNETKEILEKTLEQNNQIVMLANDNYAKNVEINENMNKEIMSISSNLNKIKIS